MNSLILLLNVIGESLLRWILFMNLWVFVLFLLALIIDRALRGHISATNRMLLYTPIFIRLVLPIGWVSPLSFSPQFTGTDAPQYTAHLSVDSLATRTDFVKLSPLSESPLVSSDVASKNPPDNSSRIKPSKGWGTVLVYMLGICVIGIYRLIRFRKIKRLLRQARPTHLDLEKLPIRRLPLNIRVREHEKIGP